MNNEQTILIEIIRNMIKQKALEMDYAMIEKLDWEEMLQISFRHKVFPLVYKAVNKFIPVKYQALYDQKYFDILKNKKIWMLELDRILKLAEQNNIDVVLLKGPALAKIIYDNIYDRQFGDIDLLVKETDMIKMYYLLHDIGYVQETGFDNNTKRYNTVDKPIVKGNSDFHELQCIKDIGDNNYVFVEIKRASSAVLIKHIEGFHENVQNICIDGINIKTSNFTYTFLHLYSNFFTNFETLWGTENDTNLREIVDTGIFISKYGDLLDWSDILLLSNEYEMTHKIYYVFKCLQELFDKIIPDDIIESFNPNKVTYDFIGNSDGSINAWESDFVYRLFNDEERKREFIKINKKEIYKKYYNLDEIEKDSFLNFTNCHLYRHLIIEPLQWDIEYMLTCDDRYLYLNLFLENYIYEQLGDYFIFVSFTDNNFDNAILNRTITITDSEGLQVLFVNLQHCSWQFIELGNKRLVRIFIPFESLDMDFKESGNLIFYNIHCREKIGYDAFRNIGSKYGHARLPNYI
jgi:hypothetical protein